VLAEQLLLALLQGRPQRVVFVAFGEVELRADELGTVGLVVLLQPVGVHQARRVVVGVLDDVGQETFFGVTHGGGPVSGLPYSPRDETRLRGGGRRAVRFNYKYTTAARVPPPRESHDRRVFIPGGRGRVGPRWVGGLPEGGAQPVVLTRRFGPAR